MACGDVSTPPPCSFATSATGGRSCRNERPEERFHPWAEPGSAPPTAAATLVLCRTIGSSAGDAVTRDLQRASARNRASRSRIRSPVGSPAGAAPRRHAEGHGADASRLGDGVGVGLVGTDDFPPGQPTDGREPPSMAPVGLVGAFHEVAPSDTPAVQSECYHNVLRGFAFGGTLRGPERRTPPSRRRGQWVHPPGPGRSGAHGKTGREKRHAANPASLPWI